MTLSEVRARFLNLVKLGRVTLVDDSATAQTLQVKFPSVGGDGNPLSDLPRLSEYGFSSSPPIGSEVVVVSLDGNRTHGLVVATNHQQSRPTGLSAGDAMLYTSRGQMIWQAPGQTVVDCAGAALVFKNFSTCTFDGEVQATGDVIANCKSGPVSLATHQHPLQGPGVPETGAPFAE